MKFATASLALVASALAANTTTSYEVDTVTNNHTTEITITSCADNKCATTVQSVTNTVVTTTVDGVKTVYTTICPLTESASATPVSSATPVVSTKPTTLAAESAVSSSSDDVTYVDITTTPVVTASTGIQSTVYKQSTFTSVYNSSTSASPSVVFANNAPKNLLAGAAGVAGVAALLL
ncbi:hypothetical protein OXX79_003398 [Metschnikowia pulcherrima]